MLKNYLIIWWKHLRPFSLSVAIISSIFGGILDWKQERFNYLIFFLVILSAILLQAGTNLINNFFEFKKELSNNKNDCKLLKQAPLERNIFISGLLCFAFFIPIWIYFIYIRGMIIFILGLIGLWGGYAYTGETFI